MESLAVLFSKGHPEDLQGLQNWLPELLPFQPVPSNDLTHIGKLSGNDSGDFPETLSKIYDLK